MFNPNPSKFALKLENQLLDALRKKSGKTPRQRQIAQMVSKVTTLEYFRSLLDDETEAQLWRMYMTGYGPKLDPAGKPLTDEAGQVILDKVELNPISLKAFFRAVEYKRGMPIAVVKDENTKTEVLQVTVIGATPQFFEEQAKAKGLLVRKTKD